jgi:hypothetical protein
MSPRFEDQPWYPEWKKTINRVVAARMALDGTKPNTSEGESASREYNDALVAFRSIAAVKEAVGRPQ